MLKYLLLLLLWCPVSSLLAQPTAQSWKKRLKAADEMYEQGNYASAAEYYWSAYKVKPIKFDLAYKAGECFALVRDYKNASKAFGAVREFPKELDRVNFFHAVNLKNEGKYREAVAEFEVFLDHYQKSDRDAVYQEVLKEISGCQMAMEAMKSPSSEYYLEHMGYSVNSSLTEFAPIPVGNNIIFFSSTIDGSAKIYRTQKDITKWSKRSKVQFFTDMEQPHFGNGSFTPDGKRVYFTQCSLTSTNESICQIYVMKKTGENWSKPVKLPYFVNEPGTTNTHPNVVLEGTREIIYFVSNRSNGQGGTDIWYVIRNLNASEESYTMPVNLGSTINTKDDELTPFYDIENDMLYFSSNGHISMGGFDIFKSKGNKTTWATPSNIGMPFNSSADDMYYILKEGSKTGYMVSNRFIRPDKISTLDDDIFAFGLNDEEPVSDIRINIGGLVVDYEKPEGVALHGVKVELFEIKNDEDHTLIEAMESPDGRYEFTVESGKHFRIEATKSGYLNAFFDLMTFEVNESSEIDQNIPLERIPGELASTNPEATEQPSSSQPPPAKPEAESEVATLPPPPAEEAKPGRMVLPIDPGTGQPLPGRENDFGEPLHKLDLTTYEQYSLIMTTDKNLGYLRKNDLWIPVNLAEITESGVTESSESAPVAEAPVTEKPVVEEPEVEMPIVEKPVVEKPEAETQPEEEPVVEVPVVVEPPVVETVIEEPKIEDIILPEPPPAPVEEVVEEPVVPVPVEEKPFVPAEVIKETKAVAAVEYKIQLVAVQEYKDHRYSRIKDLGPMEFEEVTVDAGVLTRVLIGGFPDARTARRALAKAHVRGFGRAFAIRYENGARVGHPFR